MNRSKILIFDDDERIRTSLIRNLSLHQYDCEGFPNPFIHPISHHVCSVGDAPCRNLAAIICDFDLKISEGNGVDFLQRYLGSRCVRKEQISLIIASGDLPKDAAVRIVGSPIKRHDKPFQTEQLIFDIGTP